MSDRTRPVVSRVRRKRSIVSVLAGASLMAMLVACAAVAGIDGLEIGACKGGQCEAESGAADATAPQLDGAPEGDATSPENADCPWKGAPMVRVGSASNGFCIDATEATVAQYRAFLATKPNVADQPAECAWNQTYEPATTGPDDVPQVGIDWCDARAYCKSTGKRLCGKIVNGADPGTQAAEEELSAADVAQWYIACSNQGQSLYPYGATEQPNVCNLAERDAGKPFPVTQDSGCVGGYPGVSNMIGNVWEWIDFCHAGDAGADGGPQSMECYCRGGSFLSPEKQVNCKTNGTGATRDLKSSEIGVRCCAP